MMTLNAAVAALGAVAANSTAMPNSKQGLSLSKGKKASNMGMRIGFLFLLALLFSTTTANAQNLDTLLASTFNLKVVTSGGNISAGQPTTLQIELGDDENIVNNAIAFTIELKIDEGAIFPSTPIVNTGSSWFFDPNNSSLVVVADSSSRTIEVNGFSAAATGEGNLFDLVIFAGPDGIDADQIVNSTGGIVIVEDIGYKKPATSAHRPTGIFPNPFRDQLNFNWGASTPNAVQVIDQQGAVVSSLTSSQIQNGKWAAADIPPGLYHLKIEFATSTEFFRIVKN